MSKNYTKLIAIALTLFLGLTSYSQDIHFTFANALNTNDGSDDYYEVDVMIQTINTTGTFKLGSGQLYFNYNTTAFGTNVKANAGITVTYTNPDYIAGQYVDAAAANIYGPFTTNDNTTSRVSWSFSQAFSRSSFSTDNVTNVPKKLCHLKIKYLDVNADPMLVFEDGVIYSDQFFTACGLDSGGAFGTADCGAEPGTQLVNDSFDSSGATLSNKDFDLLTGLSIYPNPTIGTLYIKGDVTKLTGVNIYNLIGQHVLKVKDNLNKIDISSLPAAMYLVKLDTNETSGIYRVIKE